MKVWYLIVLVYGSVTYESPTATTASDCALQAAYKIIQVDQFLASGGEPPDWLGGVQDKSLTRYDIQVGCFRMK